MVVQIPYSDFKTLESDSAKLADVKAILETEFPDDTCQLIAVKSMLGIETKKDDDNGGNTDPTDPPSGTDPSTPPTGGDPSGSDPSGTP